MTIFTTSHYHSDNLLTSDCQSALHKNNNARLFIRHCLGYIYHRLRGSASTVWTATSQVNGRWQILTSHRIETHELQQNSAQLITSARGPPKPNLVQIHPLGASGHTGEIERFCAFFIYLYLFFWDSHTGQTGWWIFTRDSSLDVKSRKNVPFRGYKT